MNVLAGDLGGTNARLLIAAVNDQSVEILHEQIYAAGDYPELAPLLSEYLQTCGHAVGHACLAVAGPVTGSAEHQQANITNLPWQLDNQTLARETGLKAVQLVNDFAAMGQGIEALDDAELICLQAGKPQPRGTRALIGAGTGLGQALLVWQRDGYETLPTEGGHADFAPANALEARLLLWLAERYGHVSWERVLSGSGLVNIFEFLCQQEQRPSDVPADAAKISRAALQQADATAQQAMELFVHFYGCQAGNLALTSMPCGGLFIGGGIAAKNAAAMGDGQFVKSFCAKGRMQGLMQAIPIWLINSERTGMLGAARLAARLANNHL